MKLKRPTDHKDHQRGPPNARVTLVEYGDFECPFCGAAFWELKKVEQAAQDILRFVFRHFPLTQMHPNAMSAAEAAEAAGAQGRFWDMHELLYTHQDRLDPSALMTYAAALDLDLDQFTDDLQRHVHVPKIRRDFLEGVRSGVNGTPSFFINGMRYTGSYTAPALLRAIAEVDARQAEESHPQ